MSALPALLVNLDQRTPEWLEWRRSHRMASESVALMGCAPKWMPVRTPLGLYNAKVLGVEPPRGAYLDYVAERGNRLEPRAMAKVEELLGVPLAPCVIARGDYGASLDGGDFGFALEDEPLHVEQIAEVKVPARGLESARGISVSAGELTLYDEIQVQHQLMVSGARVCHFGVFDAQADALRVVEVTPDPSMHISLCEAWDKFWLHIESESAPEPGPDDVIERDDDEWQAAVTRYRQASAEFATAEASKKASRAILEQLAGDISTVGHGLRVARYQRKGSIAYAKVPAIKEMDLEKYRGKSSMQTRITEIN